MNKHLLFTAILLLNFFYFINTKAQLNRDLLKTHPEVCSVTSYLPVNNPHIPSVDLIAKDKTGRMLFASRYSPHGISAYKDGLWSYIDNSNFLVSNSINTIFVDSKKNTWIGTSKGLNLFDGVNWKTYDLTQFGKKDVYSISEDKNGKLWFYDYSSAVTYDGTKWEVVNFDINSWITDPVYDKSSNLWFIGNNCIYKYDGSKSTKYTTSNGLNSQYIAGVSEVDGDVYCFYQNLDSVSKFENDKWVNVNIGVKSGSGFKKMIRDKLNRTWLLGYGGGVFMKDEFGWKSFLNLGIYSISSMYMDDLGDFWFGNSYSQIVKYNSEGPVLLTKRNNDGIGSLDVKSLIVDKDNKLWVHYSNSLGSISSFDGKNWINYNQFYGYSCTFAKDKNENLYLSAGNIYKYDGKDWVNLAYSEGINYNDTRGLIFDKSNQMWFATSVDVVVRVAGNTITEFKQADGILNKFPRKIVEDKDGKIWVLYGGYESKASVFNGTQWSTIELPITPDGQVDYTDAVCDTSGNMWFSSAIGLAKYDRITQKFKLYNTYNSGMAFSSISSLYLDKNNNLWCGSVNDRESYYISVLNIKDAVWKNYPLFDKDAFCNNTITGDNQNNIYVGNFRAGLYKMTFNAEKPEVTKTDIVCTGAADGSLKLKINSDLSQLYSIDNGKSFKTDTEYTQLLAGTYLVKAKNGSCVSETQSINIAEPSGSFIADKKDITCNGKSDGSISIKTQGLDNIDYLWNTGETTAGLSNLAKGKYTVTVKHSGTCNFQRIFNFVEPTAMSVVDSFYNNCGHKGAIYLSVKGGTEPYTYAWSNSKATANNEGLEPGTYKVNITDNNNCSAVERSYTISTFPEIPAKEIISKTKDYLCGGSAVITATSGYNKYQWYKRNTVLNYATNAITATDSGLYKVKVTNADKCFAFDTIKVVPRSQYEIPQICLVTVDEETNKNKIIWNKFKADSLVKVVIEKESNQSGIYSQIGNVASYQNGVFIDQTSTPLAKAERYRIRVLDECAIMSTPGAIHKTIHLTASVGSNKEVNLVWSGYEGFIFGSYNIYRGSSKSNLNLLTTIQNNLNSYTDVAPPSGGVYYVLEAISPSVCSPDVLKSGNASTRSNFADNGATSLGRLYNSDIEVSPNPSRNGVKVRFGKNFTGNVRVKLLDLTGKTLYLAESISEDNFFIERNNIPSGIYTLIIEGKEVFRTKVIFQ